MKTQTTNDISSQASGTVELTDVTPVTVVTSLERTGLVLTVDGTVIGTVSDKFCENNKPPANLRLNVLYLPNGTKVSGTWRGNDEEGCFKQDDGDSLAYADFPIPAVGATPVDYHFTIVVDGSGHERRDPVVVVFQVDDC